MAFFIEGLTGVAVFMRGSIFFYIHLIASYDSNYKYLHSATAVAGLVVSSILARVIIFCRYASVATLDVSVFSLIVVASVVAVVTLSVVVEVGVVVAEVGVVVGGDVEVVLP